MSLPTLNPKCDRYEDCEKRREELDRRIDKAHERMDVLDDRVRAQGESIAALRAQVAMWAAVGALAGGGLVSIVVNLAAKS